MHKRIANLYFRTIRARKTSPLVRKAARLLYKATFDPLSQEGPSSLIRFMDEYGTISFSKLIDPALKGEVQTLMQELGCDMEEFSRHWTLLLSRHGRTSVDSSARVLKVVLPIDSYDITDAVFTKAIENIRSDFIHEAVHMFDFLRGGAKPYDRQTREDMSEYYNHPLEVNARVHELIEVIERDIQDQFEDILNNSKHIDNEMFLFIEIAGIIGSTGQEEVRKYIRRMSGEFMTHVTPEVRERVAKRIYREVEDIKEKLRSEYERRTGYDYEEYQEELPS